MAETSWSTKQLCYVFIGSVLFFSILRWDMDAWLSAKLNLELEKNHIPLSYQGLDAHMDGLNISQAVVKLPSMPKPLLLNKIQARVNWRALWHGNLSFDVVLENTFLQWKSQLSLQDEHLNLNDIHVSVDVNKAQLWSEQSALFQAKGKVLLQGDITLDKKTAIPLSANLNILWNHAAIHALNQDYSLGDYHLHWAENKWSLEGGEQLQVSGEGHLNISAAPLLQWPLQGNITFAAQAQGKVAALLPSNPLSINLAGRLGSPAW